jgi:hypothetical protein
VALVDLCVMCLVSCSLVAVVLWFVGCRQFLGIVDAELDSFILKKIYIHIKFTQNLWVVVGLA